METLQRLNRQFTPDVTYFSGIRGPECRYDHNSEKTIWYVYDGLGSVVGELEAKGVTSDGYAYAKVTATRKFDVYGLPRAGGTGQSSTNHGFVGSLGHTSESSAGGLIYMRARWMDPALGRFISEDPARDGVNWFTYCQNNPVNNIDESGQTSKAVKEFLRIDAWVLTFIGINLAVAAATLGVPAVGFATIGVVTGIVSLVSLPAAMAIGTLLTPMALAVGAVMIAVVATAALAIEIALYYMDDSHL